MIGFVFGKSHAATSAGLAVQDDETEVLAT